ncbi:inactive selenide, water dikinase-like protein [Patiria miniata]|uniref:Selenide, water dikinase n=1 Tax=Patiria miniata TaxID=46514 RepID=A0A913ZSE6_PATMI|nr:inactive selenide, water dikinase-like protein [Patiria miniata]
MGSPRSPFDPVANGLDKDFQLTRYSDLKDFGAKVPQDELLQLLQTVKDPEEEKTAEEIMLQQPNYGIGSDCSVVPLQHGGLFLVETTDFSYPVVDDPYIMGQIACADVLSDLYAMGIMECDNMLMLLAVPQTFSDKEREVVIPLMMQGFKDIATVAGSKIRGGQTVLNPWCTIGGIATSVCTLDKIVCPDNAVPGDVLVLTKPLGTMIALTARKWLTVPDKKKKLNALLTAEELERGYQEAVFNMCKLNSDAASMMATYNAHGATDVSGFGILGHAEALVRSQKEEVSFAIHNLPIIAKMQHVAKGFIDFKLFQGRSPEVSGGLLIAFPREQAASYCKEIDKMGSSAWIIGIVEKGNRTAKVIDKPRVIEVTTKIM